MQSQFFLHMQLKKTSFLKACLEKSLKLTPLMPLKHTTNFDWDLNLGQIRTARQKKKKKGACVCERDILNQAENYEISVCLDLCMSQCVSFFFLNNIAEDVNEF